MGDGRERGVEEVSSFIIMNSRHGIFLTYSTHTPAFAQHVEKDHHLDR